jgi:glutamine synthetase adenylyltransferase
MANTEDSKPTKDIPSGSKIYTIGNVGAGAQVAQGEYIQQVNNALAGVPDSDVLKQQFAALMKRIEQTPDLDAETRDLALEKTKAVAEGLANAKESPSGLSRALRDAKAFLTSSVKGAWEGLSEILKSEAAQKTISAIAEGTTKGAIAALIGGA